MGDGFTFIFTNIFALVPLFLVMLLGIPHGAADGLIALRARLVTSRTQAMLFGIGYLALCGLVIGCWQVAPVLSLAGFLFISAVHFGLGDSVGDFSRPQRFVRVIAHGGSVVLLIPLFHAVPAIEVFTLLSGTDARIFLIVMNFVLPLWLAAFALLVWDDMPGGGREVMLLSAMIAMYFVLPPLWGFAVYFCAVHSRRHFAALARLYQQSENSEKLPAMRHFFWQIFAFSAVVVMAMLVVAVQLQGTFEGRFEGRFEGALTASVFIGLAALTVPHMLLVDGLRFKKGFWQAAQAA
jgi:Brp/Blh family beta-carotene 15,15'-monooxygenase